MVNIWIATTNFRRPERWDPKDGGPSLDTFIDGASVSEEIAKGHAMTCRGEPVRWFKTRRGLVGCHHPIAQETHFHIVTEFDVDTGLDEDGWPTR